MFESTLHSSQMVEDVFAGTSSVEEISFEEALSDRDSATTTSTDVVVDGDLLAIAEVDGGHSVPVTSHHQSQDRQSDPPAGEPPEDQNSPRDFQMWGQVSFKFAEVLATWRREERWRQVAPSWEAFVLQHIKLSQTFVNELCELADRADNQSASGVGELEPFIPCSVAQVAQRILQYLQTRPNFSELSSHRRHCLDASEYIEFELEDFRIYVWFEYVMSLDGQPHHFTRPWISNIDFQLCGEGFGEGLYSWLNISHSDIQLRQNASVSTLSAWSSWAEAFQQELARNFVPSRMAVAIESPLAASSYRSN